LDLGEHPRAKIREQFYKGKRKRLKSRSGRRDIPLSPGMADQLLALRRDTYRDENGPVFATSKGTPMIPGKVSAKLKKAASSVGLPWVTAHSFRHTCASLLFVEGRNVKQVQEWLGAQPRITLQTYVHLMDEGIGDATFMDTAIGNGVATQAPETAANDSASVTVGAAS
jgi:integrase